MEQGQGSAKHTTEERASEILQRHLDRSRSEAGNVSGPNAELLNHLRNVKGRHLIARQWLRFFLKPAVMLGIVALIGFFLFWNADPAVTTTVMFDTTAHAQESQIQSRPDPTPTSVVPDTLAAMPPQAPSSAARTSNRDTLRAERQPETESASPSRSRQAVRPILNDSIATVGSR